MSEYHKINTIFKRDMSAPGKPLIEGDWSAPEFEYLANNTWIFTEKVDGTNIRVSVEDGTVRFGGRTDAAEIPVPLLTRLQGLFLPQAELMHEEFEGAAVTLYGEGYGPKIQNGGKYRSDQDFVLFDVKVGHWWLRRKDVESVAAKLGLDVVPVIGEGTLHDAVAWAKRGIRSRWGDFEAEGIVATPKVALADRAGRRLIAKIKCRDFR